MAGYLGVTDERTLTPAGVAVVGKDFVPRSEYAPAPLPTHAGTGARAHKWVAPFYNQESKTVSTLRGMIADALYAGADVHLVHIGDSKTNGSGVGEGEAYLYAYPSIFRRMLGAVEGAITAEASDLAWDKRWTTPAGLRGPYEFDQIGVVPYATGTGPYQVIFASDFAHAGGTFWIHATAAAANVTVTVDGGTAQPFTVPAGNGFHPVTPTATGNTAHTYQIDSATEPIHVTTFVPTYDGPRLKVTRLGRGGSTAEYWQPGHKTDGTGLWDSFQTTAPDAVVVGVGTNGTQGTVNAAEITTLYAAIAELNIPAMALTPGGLGGEGGEKPLSDYYPMYQATWDAADLHNIPLVDFQSIIGDWPTATAAGLMADNLHENRHGYAYEAAALRTLLA